MKRVLEFYRRHETRMEKYAPAAFFLFGFFFDVLTLSRIDDSFTIIQQGAYLVLIAIVLVIDLEAMDRPLSIRRWAKLDGWLEKAWGFRDLVVPFFFGSLLSAYTLFYFKSASLIPSSIFLCLLAAMMVANEFGRFHRVGIIVRFGLLSLCLASYFGYVVPTLLGHIGLVPFLLSLLLSSLVLLLLFLPMRRREIPIKKSLGAALGVQAVFLGLYLLKLIPPVPLSVQYMGIYHKIEKENGRYRLHYRRPWFKFWQNGAQTFLAAPGDRVYVFARIFSPARFQEEIRVRWLFHDPRQGWTSWDAIPIQISGGRDEGFRGFAFKQNHSPGNWRVQLETSDGREIGRIGFEIVPFGTTAHVLNANNASVDAAVMNIDTD